MVPLIPSGVLSESYGLLIAVISGIGFGFFLERAGLGNSKKMMGQFYLYDMTVFKFMFTAISTTLAAIYLISKFGVLDLEKVGFVPTYPLSAMIGGLLLGAGFVVSGYCPGTSVVGAAVGRIDAMLVMLGMLLGSFVYAWISPLVLGLANAGGMGKQTVYGYFGLPYEWIVVAIVLVALGGFWGANVIQRKFATGGATVVENKFAAK
jgi:hypothetical protein